jgi:hypothetical protein
LVEALSVKMALFFLAFLRQFLIGGTSVVRQVVVRGTLCLVLNTFIDVLGAARLLRSAASGGRRARLLKASGHTLVGVGLCGGVGARRLTDCIERTPSSKRGFPAVAAHEPQPSPMTGPRMSPRDDHRPSTPQDDAPSAFADSRQGVQATSRKPLPAGYRQGVITAITVFIGFSLAFLRFWAFEAPGEWTRYSIAAVVIMLLPICGQIYALYRAVLVQDDDESTYRVTVKWFVWSVVGMLVAVCLAAFVLSGAFVPRSP